MKKQKSEFHYVRNYQVPQLSGLALSCGRFPPSKGNPENEFRGWYNGCGIGVRSVGLVTAQAGLQNYAIHKLVSKQAGLIRSLAAIQGVLDAAKDNPNGWLEQYIREDDTDEP